MLRDAATFLPNDSPGDIRRGAEPCWLLLLRRAARTDRAERDVVYLRLTLGRGAIIGGAIYLYRHSF